ncbi:TatD family hydrolase [Shewanella sp. A32]|uniref:TatD family hydrolase n=1 Tax=Shewanella sp. A32 TaxID=3031327 RepID=UPI0023BA2407|nr:TatD family hydrolase [Shewanella sp. A32]MDF0532748.1 TatD family hydrolase [Shewanella sp. A32]
MLASSVDMLMLTDSHAHFDAPEFDADREQLFLEMRQSGISGALIPGISPANWARQRQIAIEYQCDYALGIHPWYCPPDIPAAVALLEQQLQQHLSDPFLVAIGECGLDKPRAQLADDDARRVDWAQQVALLTPQLALAQKYQMPVVLHAVRCHHEMQAILQQFPNCHGVIHGFSGSYEVALKYWQMGFRLGIGGLLLDSSAKKLRSAVKRLPLTALLAETDAPSMTPVTAKDRRNTPLTLLPVVAEIAILQGTSNVLVSEQLENNFVQLFERKTELREHP